MIFAFPSWNYRYLVNSHLFGYPNAYRLFGISIAGSIIEGYSIRVDADSNVENNEIRFVYNLTIASIDDTKFQNINTIADGIELWLRGRYM